MTRDTRPGVCWRFSSSFCSSGAFAPRDGGRVSPILGRAWRSMQERVGPVASDLLSPDSRGHDTLDGLRATIDRAPIGLAQFDLLGRFLYVNDRLCEILGCDRAGLLNRTFHDLTFPDDLPRCLELTS